ncbi:helix-turn-helix domain-containing protein [Nocardia gamkensis]|uniref:PucR family transcriptional regulator n=1 Tax=Nocardia gamkensis TaxID=352869 RepID=UPI0033C28000
MTTLIGPPANGAEAVARDLLAHVEDLTGELVGRIRTGDHAYAESTALTADLLQPVVHDNLAAVLGQLAGTSVRRLHPAIAAGRVKAELGIPLAALMHAYRLAGRLIWEHSLATATSASQDALPVLASEVWRLIDDYSSAAAQAYTDFLTERARRAEHERQAMLRALLRGDVDGPALLDTTRALQLPQLGTFVVAYAETGAASTEPLPGIQTRLRAAFINSAWLTEPGARIGLVSLTGPQALDQALTLLQRAATGRVGVSRPFPSAAAARTAVREAELATRCARPGAPTVTRYGSAPVPLVLAHSPVAAQELADDILGPILELPDEDRDALLDVLELRFDCGGSNIEVAQRLHYHRNTIHHRLRRIETLTGRRCSDPKAAAELYIALRAARLHGT